MGSIRSRDLSFRTKFPGNERSQERMFPRDLFKNEVSGYERSGYPSAVAGHIISKNIPEFLQRSAMLALQALYGLLATAIPSVRLSVTRR